MRDIIDGPRRTCGIWLNPSRSSCCWCSSDRCMYPGGEHRQQCSEDDVHRRRSSCPMTWRSGLWHECSSSRTRTRGSQSLESDCHCLAKGTELHSERTPGFDMKSAATVDFILHRKISTFARRTWLFHLELHLVKGCLMFEQLDLQMFVSSSQREIYPRTPDRCYS